MRHTRLMTLAVLSACMGYAAGTFGAEDRKVTRYVRFQADAKVAYGIVEGEAVREIAGDLFGKWKVTDTTHPLAKVKLLTPTRPSKVLALAGNYRHLVDKIS